MLSRMMHRSPRENPVISHCHPSVLMAFTFRRQLRQRRGGDSYKTVLSHLSLRCLMCKQSPWKY